MKIDNNLKSVSNASNDAKTRSVRETSSSERGPESKVQLSALSERLAELEKTLNNSPVVDSENVASIRQAISEGRFEVHAEKVADGLIESVRQMLSAQPQRA